MVMGLVMERETLSFDEWVDIKRFAEYAAFQLVMHIFKSSVVWELADTRRGHTPQSDYRLHVRRVYGAYCFFQQRHRGLRESEHVELTARKFGLTAREVRDAIRDARLFNVPTLMEMAAEEQAKSAKQDGVCSHA